MSLSLREMMSAKVPLTPPGVIASIRSLVLIRVVNVRLFLLSLRFPASMFHPLIT